MSKSIRFLGIAICCWAGVRAVSLGLIPGVSAMAFDMEAARRRPTRLPPIQPSALPPIEPLRIARTQSGQQSPFGPVAGFMPYAYPAPQPYPVYVPIPAGAAQRSAPPQIVYVNPPTAGTREFHVYGGGTPATAGTSQLAMRFPVSGLQATPSFSADTLQDKLDRLSLSSWALMRNKGGPDSLANSGMLGGSEAGARLIWRFDPRLAATLRTSAPINSQRGMEAALGLRYQPFADWPVALTLERRHGIRDYGRNAFALFAEGGVHGQSLPWQFGLDGYFQAGVVDFNNPDWFIDGQLAATRPIWRNISAGFGLWGGAQPGLNRLDIGPRASIRVGSRTRAHLDYRLNVAGNARPGSGPTVTLAGDF